MPVVDRRGILLSVHSGLCVLNCTKIIHRMKKILPVYVLRRPGEIPAV